MTPSTLNQLTGSPTDAETRSHSRTLANICPHGLLTTKRCKHCYDAAYQARRRAKLPRPVKRARCLLCGSTRHGVKLCNSTGVGLERLSARLRGELASSTAHKSTTRERILAAPTLRDVAEEP